MSADFDPSTFFSDAMDTYPDLASKPVSPRAPPNTPELPKEPPFPVNFPAEKQLFIKLLSMIEGMKVITNKDIRMRVKAVAAFLKELDPDSPLMQAAALLKTAYELVLTKCLAHGYDGSDPLSLEELQLRSRPHARPST